MSYMQIFLATLITAGGIAGVVLSEAELMALHDDGAAQLAKVQMAQDAQLEKMARMMSGNDGASVQELIASGHLDPGYAERERVQTARPELPAP